MRGVICICLPGVEAACYVCMVDHGNKLLVWAAFEVAIPLPEIDIDESLAFW